jgi:hypothetical protein
MKPFCNLRNKLCLLLLGSLLCAPTHPVNAADPGVDSLKSWRKTALDRRRRIIFNNDGNEPTKLLKEPSIQKMLDLRTTHLVGSQVDSVFYCTKSSGFGLFTHLTKVGEVFLSQEGFYSNSQMPAFLKAGIDPFQVFVDFCKKNDLEIFWSMRMNDTHDGARVDYGPIMFRASKLKNEHPEYLLGTPQKRPKHGAWTAVNYGLPEIRELAFRYFEEVCQNYDIDGVELDFFRHPVFFQSNAEGEPATDEERAAMTELLARIRNMADEVGKKRGRPILIAVRTPDSVEYCRAIGLDIENWFANDLCDLFIPSGTFQLNPWPYSVALGHKYGMKVYPSLDEARVRDPEGKELRMTELAYRGRAAEVWESGADGIYLFNFFDYKGSDSSILRELGDREQLAKLDLDYFAAARTPMNAAGGNLPFQPFLKIETLDPDNPKKVTAGDTVRTNLNVPEDLSKRSGVALQLVLKFKEAPNKSISVFLNDKPLTNAVVDDKSLTFSVDPTTVEKGANQVDVRLEPNAGEAVWTDLILQVRDKP